MCVISGFYHSVNESLLYWVVKEHRLIFRYAKTLILPCLRRFLMFTKHLFLQIQQSWLSVQAWTFAPSDPTVTMNINAP